MNRLLKMLVFFLLPTLLHAKITEEERIILYKEAVKSNGKAIQWIPKKHHTYEMYLTAIRTHPELIHKTPKKWRDEAFYLAFVQSKPSRFTIKKRPMIPLGGDAYLGGDESGAAIELVPKKYRTYEISLAAIQNYIWSIDYISKKIIDYPMALVAVTRPNKMYGGYRTPLSDIPKALHTPELYLIAAEHNIATLLVIPADQLTLEIVGVAFSHGVKALSSYSGSGGATKFKEYLDAIPPELRTYAFYLKMQEDQTFNQLRYVPREFLSTELLKVALSHGASLQFVPPELLTYELALLAVQNNRHNLKHIPAKWITYELSLASVRHKFPHIDPEIPQEYRTYQLYLELIKHYPFFFSFSFEKIPKEFLTYELTLLAVQGAGGNIRYVPPALIDRTMALTAARGTDGVIDPKYPHYNVIPVEFLDYEFYFTLASHHVKALQWIPKEFQTYELVLAAVKNNGNALEYLPDTFATR